MLSLSLLRRVLNSEYLIPLLTALYFLGLLPVVPTLGSTENLANLLSSSLPLIILGVGQTVVLISGGIDLSVTSILALTSVTGAALMTSDSGWLPSGSWAGMVGLCAMLMTGGILGAANGCAVALFRLPPFIVTLTSMLFVSGFAIWATHSRNIAGLPASFVVLGSWTPLALLLTLLLLTTAHLLLSRSVAGRWLFAVGHNAEVARISGVPVRRVVLGAYVVSGICAGLASVLYTGRLETGSPVLGQRLLLDVVGATVIGGTSLYGGKGKVSWTIYGALFLTLLDNSFNLLNLSYFSILIAKGTVILLAALLDSLRHRLLESVHNS